MNAIPARAPAAVHDIDGKFLRVAGERFLVRGVSYGTFAPRHDGQQFPERAHIRRVLERSRWAIEGEHGAARILGLNPSTLRGRLRKLRIHRR